MIMKIIKYIGKIIKTIFQALLLTILFIAFALVFIVGILGGRKFI